jgi:hypothetical protein
MQISVVVSPGGSNIAGAQSPLRDGDYGGCHLPAQPDVSRQRVGFPVACGELGKPQHNVGGVFSDACEIDDGKWHEAKA